jgi:uncharacterized protein (DUF302 family)
MRDSASPLVWLPGRNHSQSDHDERVKQRDRPCLEQALCAAKAGLTMPPAQLLIFGNPQSGTPLMLASPTAAIDLPLKALAWQDEQGRVWLSYNSPIYIQQRHQLPHELLKNIAGIKSICEEAAYLEPNQK